jgi:hypothetical protein
VLYSLETTEQPLVLSVRDTQTQQQRNIVIPAGVPITRNLQAVSAAALCRGDLITVTFAADGTPSAITAGSQQVQGTVAGVTEDKILLQNGTLYALGELPELVDSAGQPIQLADLQRGQAITLRITPGTTTAWAVMLPAAPKPEDEPPVIDEGEPPVIHTVIVKNYTRPLREGDTLTLLVTGTPGADEVIARIGRALTGIKLTEGAPGKYSAQVTIGPKVPAVTAPV